MNEQEMKSKQIRLLQQNLSSIRKIAGMTMEQLGNKVGVTKQTISNLENGKTPMTLTQYIALRSILDNEIESNPDNSVLPQVISILVDNGAELDEEQYLEIKDTVGVVAASASSGKKEDQLFKTFLRLLKEPATLQALTALGIMITQYGILGKTTPRSTNWLTKILK